MFKKIVPGCILALLILFIVAGCGGQDQQNEDPAAAQGEKYNGLTKLSIGASSVGSSSYTKMAVWSNYIADKLNLNITPEGTAGSEGNAELVNVGEVDMASSMANLSGQLWEEGKLDNVRLLTTVDSFALQFYALKESGIDSIDDLNGKSVNLSKAGSGTDMQARKLFEQLGIKPSKIFNVSPSEANNLMRDGVLDVSGCMGSIHPSIVEMSASKDINIFGLDDRIDEFLDNNPGLMKITIRANSYEKQTNEFVTIGDMGTFVVHKDLPEDMVYDLVKATHEGKEAMISGFPGYATMSPEDISLGIIPLHKGAYKYYQELGVDIPADMLVD